MVVIAYALIVLGGLLCLLNWSTPFASLRSGRFVSPVPLVGALALGGGMALLPETRPFFWVALIADFGTLILLLALPLLVNELWSTSRVNLLHSFASCGKGRNVTIKLFRRQIAVISADFDSPVACNDLDARVESFGFVGTWTATASGFSIRGYGEDRRLLVARQKRGYVITELNYPHDKKYKYDCLDGLVMSDAMPENAS